jgi:GrpB-like predicted nucleotidyltransferase (UPF0157 family)
MALYQLNQKSSPVVVVPYQDRWPAEFDRCARALRAALGKAAPRIDHIGSTSVPGLAAKDIIDVQITVDDLGMNAPWADDLRAAGFDVRTDIFTDHQPPWFVGDPSEWSKRYAREPRGERRTHIHIRQAGRQNQRFALLFRDFLRRNERYAVLYALVKSRLSELFPESIDNYLYIKDPVVDVIISAAESWARDAQWALGPSDA